MTAFATGRQLREAGMELSATCAGTCTHKTDDHRYYAEFTTQVRGRDVPSGGRFDCSVGGCGCAGTWSLSLP